MKKYKTFLRLLMCTGLLGSVSVYGENVEVTGIIACDSEVTAISDYDVLSYPGRKDGKVIGEILEGDELTVTGTIGEEWSQILFLDDEGDEQKGFVPNSVLRDGDEITGSTEIDEELGTGVLHKSEGSGIFADAVEGVTSTADGIPAAEGVSVGTPESVSSEAVLRSLGEFKITHYCSCSICCGPWSDGATSTGVTATTNRTIAVDPTQIPYGSRVVINGQIYVAEDCGGAITKNCIDIYVGSHEEGEEKGVFYTEVYLLEED